MNPELPIDSRQTRREFLSRSAAGLGSVAMTAWLGHAVRAGEAAADGRTSLGRINPLHFAPKAKRVIFLYQAGGPSHLETFDHKPKLAELHGKPMPESYTKGQPIAQLQGKTLNCFAPQFPFGRWGESGQQVCSLFPGIGSVADEICIIRSMVTEAINHDPAHTFMNTGMLISGRPAMGSWLLWGIGSEATALPGFVVLTSIGKGGQSQPIAARQWHSGFLPSRYQGVEFQSTGDPVLYVGSPDGVDRSRQRDVVDAVNAINRLHGRSVNDPEIETRMAQYEMAYRMQESVPDLVDFSNETEETFELYGTRGGDGSYAANCLLARRLAERGVRFIQLYHRAWDHHGGIKRSMEITAKEVDQATAALIQDLKRRGMLDETLVLWGGEFGRTPMAQGDGRDHHMKGFSMFLCGGGIKPGISRGATDELGYNAVEDVVHVHDLHATLLYLLGIDHEKMTYRYRGRDFRLTDVGGHVVREILA
jgi:hypothetical protein